MRRSPSWWLFWSSLSLIVYTYIGFPILVFLRGLLFKRPLRNNPQVELPHVSIIIAAYNEEANIIKKLDTIFALEYPRTHLDVLVASDGSDDRTNELVANYPAPEVRLLECPRQGKNPTLNRAVELTHHDILVFTDADSILTPDTLRHLVAPFSDPDIGGVSGDYRYAADPGEGEEGERVYWSFDRLLKKSQSQAGSVTAVTGSSIYAIRRSLFEPLPQGVTDDFFNMTRVTLAHRRMLYEPHAIAYGPIASTAGAEFRRKVRVMTRGLRGVWLSRRLLNPFEYGFFALQLFSHKVLRRLVAFPMLITGITAPLLWNQGWLYRVATLCQTGLHSAALLGFLLRDTPFGKMKFLSLPFFLDMVNIAGVVALFNLVRGKRRDIWTRQ